MRTPAAQASTQVVCVGKRRNGHGVNFESVHSQSLSALVLLCPGAPGCGVPRHRGCLVAARLPLRQQARGLHTKTVARKFKSPQAVPTQCRGGLRLYLGDERRGWRSKIFCDVARRAWRVISIAKALSQRRPAPETPRQRLPSLRARFFSASDLTGRTCTRRHTCLLYTSRCV